jgi:excisionase family DNA binding protein
MKEASNLISVADAARILGVTTERVRQLVRGGHLESTHIGSRGWWFLDRRNVEALRRHRERHCREQVASA